MKTLTNKIFAVFLIGAGILTVHISGGDATACVFLWIIGIPLFFAKTNWFYEPKSKKHNCVNCSKYKTLMCPNSHYCYSNPKRPEWEQNHPRIKNRCYSERKS